MSGKSKIFVSFDKTTFQANTLFIPTLVSPRKAMQMPKAHWKYLISTSSREVAAPRQYTQFRVVTLSEFCHLYPAQENKVQYKNIGMNEIH